MDPINPWLDPSEVRHLAEQLLRPIATSKLTTADPGFDSAFIGYTNSRPSQPNTTPTPTTPLPPPSEPTATPPAAPDLPPKTRFLDRIQIFRDWLAKNFEASDLFILDREGKVIFDESGHGRLHFMARNLAITSRNPSNHPGNVHVKIGPEAILEVIPVETPYGRLILGTLVPSPLTPQSVQTISETLVQAASPN